MSGISRHGHHLVVAILFLFACDGTLSRSEVDTGIEDAASSADAASSTDAASPADAEMPFTPDASDASTDAWIPGPICAETTSTRTSTPSGLAVVHHDGQSFVSWRDRAEGADGAAFRYRLYRSDTPITDDAALEHAELIARGILNHSGQLFGGAFLPAQRLDATRPMAIVAEGESPLPAWSGLWVANTSDNGCAYFAVLATDATDVPVESIEPGVNATTGPVAETVAPRAPIKVYDSNSRGIYSPQTRVTGTPNLPLVVFLHASMAGGGGAGDYGDYFLYFGDRTMGFRDGMPGVFSVEETHSGLQYLMMRNRDTIVSPSGSGGFETHWFGYLAEPEWGGERLVYPFTDTRLDWMIRWVISRYAPNPERVVVTGGSMGAWGTMTYGFRRPELFAAVFPDRPRFRQTSLLSIAGTITPTDPLPTGQTWTEHHDSIHFVRNHPGDLPFLGWNCGRQDGFATWAEQVEMVQALVEGHHGFAFAWNNGNHGDGGIPRAEIARWYPYDRFGRNESYPAFGNSSIDDDPGTGDPSEGDLVGGINLGFDWSVPIDEVNRWSADISNALATADMTVDVTPRRTQHFDPTPGTVMRWTDSLGGSGTVSVDANGLVTVPALRIRPGVPTTLTITLP
jgi:hypothetical protein